MQGYHNDDLSVGAHTAKTHLGDLLKRVRSGEEITITWHGSPVARLVPCVAKRNDDERRQAIETWIDESKGLALRGMTIRELIDTGRR